jgi:hypothetical protein
MDEPPFSPTAGGCFFSLEAAGEAWSWRLTTPEGESVAGFAPDRSAARRSAAFAAFAVTALSRARRRRP